MKWISGLWATALVAGAFSATAANAGTWQFSFYGGWNQTPDSDVTFTGPGTDWTLHSVPWTGLSFNFAGGPPYYGYRLTYWPTASKNFGIALDISHLKMRAVRDATISYDGTINGTSTPGSGQVNSVFDVLEYTNGLNVITLNALYKLPQYGILHPYVGIGAGFGIPHVEVTGTGAASAFQHTFAYEFGGPAVQAIGGLDVPLTKRISAFGEYKLTWAKVDAPVNGGYRIHTTTVTNQLLGGVSFSFGG